jgi:gliding motility-associated lipoprotein GldD
MKNIQLKTFLFFAISILLLACSDDYLPKPQGYFRIDLPEKTYRNYEAKCPLSFDVPEYSAIELFENKMSSDSCWFNIYFKRFNARVHCTYMPVKGDFDALVRDAYGFAISHEVKASALKRTAIQDPERKIYGMIYDIEGDAASQLQFFVTDSANHFFRGSLYFYNSPNPDSIAPVLQFLKEDVVRLVNTMEWR